MSTTIYERENGAFFKVNRFAQGTGSARIGKYGYQFSMQYDIVQMTSPEVKDFMETLENGENYDNSECKCEFLKVTKLSDEFYQIVMKYDAIRMTKKEFEDFIHDMHIFFEHEGY